MDLLVNVLIFYYFLLCDVVKFVIYILSVSIYFFNVLFYF